MAYLSQKSSYSQESSCPQESSKIDSFVNEDGIREKPPINKLASKMLKLTVPVLVIPNTEM